MNHATALTKLLLYDPGVHGWRDPRVLPRQARVPRRPGQHHNHHDTAQLGSRRRAGGEGGRKDAQVGQGRLGEGSRSPP